MTPHYGFYWYRQTTQQDGPAPYNEWIVVELQKSLPPHMTEVSFPGTDVSVSIDEALSAGEFGPRVDTPPVNVYISLHIPHRHGINSQAMGVFSSYLAAHDQPLCNCVLEFELDARTKIAPLGCSDPSTSGESDRTTN